MPPPIFIYGVTNLPEMRKTINELTNEDHYTIRSLANNTIKLLCQNPDTYRKLAKYMKEKNIIHHTYQPKEECSYRVVIRYLHHSVDIQELKEEISRLGHTVRNIINARHRITKDPLNLFFCRLRTIRQQQRHLQHNQASKQRHSNRSSKAREAHSPMHTVSTIRTHQNLLQ